MIYTKNMKHKLFGAIFLCLILLASSVQAKGANSVDDGGWVKDHVKHGLTVYTRKVADSSILGIKTEGVINAPLPSIMANLRDVENSTEWIPDQISKITIEDVNDRKAITLSVSSMPWPLYDRELLLVNELKLDKKRKLLFVLSNSLEMPEIKVKDGQIRAHIGYSNMGMKPVGRNKTYVELTAFVDPKGSIPTWVTNFFQVKWPVQFLKDLEKRSNEVKPPLRPGLQKMLKDLLKLHNLPEDLFNY